MKKIIMALVFVLVAVGIGFAQADGMLNLTRYAEYFGFQGGRVNPTSRYIGSASREERRSFSDLAGNEVQIDTPLEFALLSYYSQPVLNIRPAEANRMIGTPRQADLKLGAAVFQEIQILRFLGDTAAVNRHEAVLSFITGRGNATRTEIETYYRNGIRGLIAGIVDEEFNSISFTIRDNAVSRTYTAVLTRNPQNGEYTLSYARPEVQNSGKELSAPSLEALLLKMRNDNEYKNDFSQSGIDTVRAQAALIPAVALSDAALAEITNIITRFYTEPNQSTYTAVVEAYKIIDQALLNTSNLKYSHVSNSYERMLSMLNRDFAQKVFVDERTLRSITILTRDQQ
jgi:hypothetical protein